MDVEPGRVRQARLEAGLSVDRAAGRDLTRQAIFLIEAGRPRPSMRTLEMIAGRTGRPAESFFRKPGAAPASRPDLGDSRLMDLQALCLQQQFDKCIRLGIPMLSEPLPPSLEPHLQTDLGPAP